MGMAAEAQCPAMPAIPEQPRLPEGAEPGTISLEADTMDLQEEGVSTLRGRAEVVRDDQAVSASLIRYDNVANVLEAEGDIRYWDSSLFVTGEKVRVELDRKLGRLEQGTYALRDERGHGKAALLLIDRRENQTRIEQADYTTCPGEVPDWKLDAARIDLDHETDRGSARNVTLRVRDVPVLYLPYISFPLSDKRKTGFLFPSLGSSRESGFDIGLPFYWNIAPNYDATFIARYIENRGVMGRGEFRYLRPDMYGQINIDYLPNDRRFNDQDRALFRFSHYQSYERGRAYLTYNHASDKQYLEDFGRGLALSSTRFLDQRLEADYNGDWWTTQLLVQEYQNVDASLTGQSPYRQLPRLRFFTRLPERNRQLNFQVRAEGVYFDHQDLVRGGRIDLLPSVSYPLVSEWGFLRPRLSFRHTQYFLQDQPAGNDNSPSRSLPIFSLDSGLFLERDFSLGGQELVQTLEPRIFYLYIPKRNQGRLPVFDTAAYDISFSQLFREDRFSGPDRVGDANQITLALTSRLFQGNNGRERLRVSLGEIIYLRDREVTLPAEPVRDHRFSEFIGEAAARITDDWTATANFQWNPTNGETDKTAVNLYYRPGGGKVLNLGYRFRKFVRQTDQAGSDIEQADISLRWPINPSWSVIGRWNHSIINNEVLEGVLGFEYNSCCWGLRAVARRYLATSDGKYDNTLFLQLELKGLAGIGRKTETFLKRAIPGYQPDF